MEKSQRNAPQSLKNGNAFIKHVYNALTYLNERDGSKPKHIFGQVLSDIFLNLLNPLTIESDVGKALQTGVKMGVFQRKRGNRFLLAPLTKQKKILLKRNVDPLKNGDSLGLFKPVDRTRRRRQRRRRRSNRRIRRHDQEVTNKDSGTSASSKEDGPDKGIK